MLKARPLYFKKENNENEKLKYNSLSVQSLISIALSQLSAHVNLGKISPPPFFSMQLVSKK